MPQIQPPVLKSPLADRMRPRNLEEYVGQSHILSPGRLLWRIIKADQPSCLIFYGPPGTGKTSLARVIAQSTRSEFLTINAVLGGVKDIREAVSVALENQRNFQRRTILFIDEVHRFNKSQQDALLPHTENGVIIFIGATTENPYFEVNKALISRSRIFELKSLSDTELKQTLDMALRDNERGFGKLPVEITDEAAAHWIRTANGDARALLNAMELAVLSSQGDGTGPITIDLRVAEESIQKKAALYDKDGDAHYDIISSFIKSLRGSDVDAALYWMARMVYAGEDPRFIFRRMIIFSSEDIGMADPNALTQVMAAAQAFDYVGMPEGRFHMAQACIYLATAVKSNSAFAFFDALNVVKKETDSEPPNHLKDGNRDKEGLNHGKGYLYPHAYEEHWVAQQYLPKALTGRLFYQPTEQGQERTVRLRVRDYRAMQLEMLLESGADQADSHDYWGERTVLNQSKILPKIKEILTQGIKPEPNSMFLQLNSTSGYLLSDFLKTGQNQIIYAHVKNNAQEDVQRHLYTESIDTKSLRIVRKDTVADLLDSFLEHKFTFDFIIGKNAFLDTVNKHALPEKLSRIMANRGVLRLIEATPGNGQRVSEVLRNFRVKPAYADKVREIENHFLADGDNPKLTIEKKTWTHWLIRAGFSSITITPRTFRQEVVLNLKKLNRLLFENDNFCHRLAHDFSNLELEKFREDILFQVENKTVEWISSFQVITALKKE